jgi:hypothetical protein
LSASLLLVLVRLPPPPRPFPCPPTPASQEGGEEERACASSSVSLSASLLLVRLLIRLLIRRPSPCPPASTSSSASGGGVPGAWAWLDSPRDACCGCFFGARPRTSRFALAPSTQTPLQALARSPVQILQHPFYHLASLVPLKQVLPQSQPLQVQRASFGSA